MYVDSISPDRKYQKMKIIKKDFAEILKVKNITTKMKKRTRKFNRSELS